MQLNGVMTVILILYLAVMIGIGILDLLKIKSFGDYAVAGKKQTTFSVTMTLMATIVGASATMGLIDTTYTIGFPGIWWLEFGSIGLILQSLLISEKVRGLNADTLPDAAGIIVGPIAERLIAAIIVISWIGVIAGQLIAMNGIVSYIVGRNSKGIFLIVSLIVLLYTTFGGQMSVVRTDMIQFILIVVGMIVGCIYLYCVSGGDSASTFQNIEFINAGYPPIKLLNQFFVIGGVYFLGPDIMSRNLIAKDEKAAKKSALIGGILLLLFAFVVILIGMWARFNVPEGAAGDMKMLMFLIRDILPGPVGVVLVFAMMSAILSSTDTCLINASSIFVKDILRKDSVLALRITVVVIGLIATAFALSNSGDIIGILSNAYSVYTPGVIFPLFIAIMCYGKKKLNVGVWVAAVVIGGVFGVIGAYFPSLLSSLPASVVSNFSLIGMGFSLVVSLLSVAAAPAVEK